MTSKNIQATRLLSPFRYPGGKTWLVPLVRKWLNSITPKPTEFIEPFAGGAIVSLNVAFDQLADHVTLAEIDRKVGSVWETIITKGEGLWLAERIKTFRPTVDSVKALLAKEEPSHRECAFQTIVHNRVSRGGILAEGAGLLKKGEDGKGLASRWYPETLDRRIRTIHSIRERLSFVWGDGAQVIHQNKDRSDVAFFIDPPYTAANGKQAGQRLYTHSELDHEALFRLIKEIQGNFIMTCDDNKYTRDMAIRYGFEIRAIDMRNTHHAQMTELIISHDLAWIDNEQT
ncbi:MAG: DNA adenine methylase [Anaerolineae bacterium]|nr:DNA adenine methylase [Anaerolineae bacterium]